jgi:cysteinyl-tRNA synthetase
MTAAYDKLVRRIADLKNDGEVDKQAFAEYRIKFENAVSDDLNTSMALTTVYDMLKADINDSTKRALIEDFDKVLSLDLIKAGETADNAVDEELEKYVLQKIEERSNAKKAKDFAKADAIRDELAAKGITIKDTREGVVWSIAK